ncbi:MAG TPA: (2Fe-2S)-binding protein [Stellaceae bacterium]|nr:(2Fe-2S)-binding protein [Stellaceae bacterium]
MATQMRLTVDGKSHVISVDDPDMPLLYALRDELGLSNPHFGCGLAQCGACTVHVNGEATRSCVTPLSAVKGATIVTLAGLGTAEHPHPLQAAYVEEQVPQCGYCVNGWIMTAAALLKSNPHPSDADIRKGLSGLKCRCGTHMAIIRAVKRAASMA